MNPLHKEKWTFYFTPGPLSQKLVSMGLVLKTRREPINETGQTREVGMLIGYGRVSTKDQDHALQVNALKEYGCKKLFYEKKSAYKKLPERDKLLAYAREGDVIVVWRFDRLGRSMKDLVNLVCLFDERNIHFVSITEQIDTRTPLGRVLFYIIAALAEFERSVLVERTNAGLAAARLKGHFGGRPKGPTKENQKKAFVLLRLHLDRELSVPYILETHNVTRATYYRLVNWAAKETFRKNLGKRITFEFHNGMEWVNRSIVVTDEVVEAYSLSRFRNIRVIETKTDRLPITLAQAQAEGKRRKKYRVKIK